LQPDPDSLRLLLRSRPGPGPRRVIRPAIRTPCWSTRSIPASSNTGADEDPKQLDLPFEP